MMASAMGYVVVVIANGTKSLLLVACYTRETCCANAMPAIEPALPPLPTTELKACFGTVSLTRVKSLAA